MGARARRVLRMPRRVNVAGVVAGAFDPAMKDPFVEVIKATAQGKGTSVEAAKLLPTIARPLADRSGGDIQDAVATTMRTLWDRWAELEKWGIALPERQKALAVDKSHAYWVSFLDAWNAGDDVGPNGVDIANLTGVKSDLTMTENVASEHGYPDQLFRAEADRSKAYGSENEVPVPSVEKQRHSLEAADEIERSTRDARKSIEDADLNPFAWPTWAKATAGIVAGVVVLGVAVTGLAVVVRR